MKRESSCTICRRLHQKLLLKGSKCFSVKCPFIKKSYPPGFQKKRGRKGASAYKKELFEKQKMKEFYNLSEKQFKNYVREILKKRGKIKDASLELVKKLEKRLDNVIFRLNLVPSRINARQLVTHGFFLVNGRSVNIPSYEVKKRELISLKETKKKKEIYKEIYSLIQKEVSIPSWLKLDKKELKTEIIGEPSLEEVNLPLEISAVFEYYSR